MKRILLLLFLFVYGYSNAQIVDIPNTNFKSRLLMADANNTIAKDINGVFFKIDSNNDNEIQVSEALATYYLDVSSENLSYRIRNFTGIQAFINLQYLNCSYNSLSNSSIRDLDLSQIVNLIELNCSDNGLEDLDISQNINLEHLDCSLNPLINLDISLNTNLRYLNYAHNTSVSNLDVTHLINLRHLNISYTSVSVLDLTQNINLEYLNRSSNNLDTINISENINLKELILEENNLTSLDISQYAQLEHLNCSDNIMPSLNVSQNTLLENLNCSNNVISILDVSQLPSLNVLDCSRNFILNLNLSQNENLEYLDCSNNFIINLNVTTCPNLFDLDCSSNTISELDLSLNPLLEELNCGGNELALLDVTENESLEYLDCSNNFIINLNVTTCPILVNLDCRSNTISQLDLSLNPLLEVLNCGDNELTLLDVTENENLSLLNCSNNYLETLLLKNGSIENYLYLTGNTSLEYVCADEEQLTDVQSEVGSSVVVNSYCSFTLGGDYNTISGDVKFDSNSNGCDVNDLPVLLNVRIDLDDGLRQGASIVNSEGEYAFYLEAGEYILTPSIENPDWFQILPETITIPFADNQNNTVTQDFCITPVGVYNDLEIVIVPQVIAQPGFDSEYLIIYKNKGNQTQSVDINFTFNDTVLDLVSTSVTPNSQATGSIAWNYSDLQPFESRRITVILNVNSPTETPAVNIGDELGFVATIEPITGDETPEDNQFPFKQIVVGSFDPNDKICLEGDVISPDQIGKYLHYTINFENTGTASATFVVVKDEIDASQYDMSTLQIMNASHAMVTTITGNKIEFIFDNINLGPDEKGYVVFKIKTLNTLQTGDTASNKADIFFDYNFPIETNLASTTFQNLSISEFEIDNSIRLFPNPVKDMLHIEVKTAIESIQLYDVQGRLVFTKILDTSQSSFDMSTLTSGVYFIKIKTTAGVRVEKLIKD